MEALALSHIADIRARYRAAMDRCEAMRSALIRRGTDFIMETVLSRADKLDELENAKSTRRCRLFSVYVGTDSPEVNVARVARRVAQGGHDVPPDKVAERYYRSMQNLGPLIELSDDMLIYDNSGAEYELLLRRRRANFTVYENAHGWFARYALPCLPE
jgi:predicted ABC-type ATPase